MRTDRDLHVVTGATSGIGRAIAVALAQSGRRVLALGRSLAELSALECQFPGRIAGRAVDLLDDGAVDAAATELVASQSRIKALVHCAGVQESSPLATAPAAAIDVMFRLNVRAPLLLTQRLIEPLERAGGYLMFLNSSAGINETAGAGAAVYAALQHANRRLAETWRQELNAKGIRVLSIFPGRTNTPRIERLFAHEGREYQPKLLLQPEDIAALVVLAVGLPDTVELTDVKLRPAKKSY
jgi:NADP-dependent 3-hydroxy acid dehydrogenase YdfG